MKSLVALALLGGAGLAVAQQISIIPTTRYAIEIDDLPEGDFRLEARVLDENDHVLIETTRPLNDEATAEPEPEPDPVDETDDPVDETDDPVDETDDPVDETDEVDEDEPEPVEPEPIIAVVDNITDRTARVSWEVGIPVTGQVFYGTATGEYTESSVKEDTFEYTHHIQLLRDLTPETQYFGISVSEDADGERHQSEEFTFTTAEKVVLKDGEESTVAGWPDGYRNDLAMGGVFYGNYQSGILTGNARIARELDRRFRAQRTGFITHVRWNNRTLVDANITGRCTASAPNSVWCQCKKAGLDRYTCGYSLGNSYSIGNGGHIIIEIREDDGTGAHQPVASALGRTKGVFVPVDNASNAYPTLALENPVKLTAGKIYHMVYRNLAPPSKCGLGGVSVSVAKSCPRNQGAIGLNGVYFPRRFGNGGEFGPFRASADAVLFRNSASGAWSQDKDNLSWYEVRYDDGLYVGDAYAAYNSIFNGATQVIGGSRVGRQVFTVQRADRHVTGLWINHGHNAGKVDGSPLNAVLKDSVGRALAKGAIAPNSGCAAASRGSDYANKECRVWGYTSLGKTVTLSEGSRYSVEFSSGGAAGFKLGTYFPLNYGGYNSSERGFWSKAQAEISTNGGQSWAGWAGNYYPERDLALLFTIEGMPAKLN